ncbi:MAG: PilX N-terminal domain-containing pilus assembly protein [Pseudomonadota bacterium]
MRTFYITRKQHGSTLFIALTFLVVITLMGLSGMQTATLQERMAGGERDYSIALQAAEMGLRDAERDLLGVDYNNVPVPGMTDGGVSCQPSSKGRVCFEYVKQGITTPSRPMLSAPNNGGHMLWLYYCQWGQCYLGMDPTLPRPSTLPFWNDQTLWGNDALTAAGTVGSSVVYGTFTGAPALSLSSQPRYILELIESEPTASSPASASGAVRNVRITSRAVGMNARTVVLLQEVFQCSSC